MSRLVLTVLLAAALGAAAAPPTPARADAPPSLPPGTEPYAGIPPYLPNVFDDAAELEGWCAACVIAARSDPNHGAAGDLLFSAAWLLDYRLGDRGGALSLYEEAALQPASGAATVAAAWLEVGRLRLARGELERARLALEAARAAAARPASPNDDAAQSWRLDLTRDRLRHQLPRLGANLAEAEGDLSAAAEDWEVLAEQAERRQEDPPRVASQFARAARLRARAGDIAKAMRDIDRALARTTSESQQAEFAMWRLHLEHEVLTEQAEIGVTRTWPGEAFVRDAHGVLGELQGNPHLAPYVLTLATRAWVSGHPAEALEFYRFALTDPTFIDQARKREDFWRGLLVAFPVALDLGRFEDAERILHAVARIGSLPRDEFDDYQVMLIDAREAVRESPPADPMERPTAPPDPPSPDRGRLLPKTPDEAGAREAPGPEAPAPGPTGGRLGMTPAWIAGAFLGVIGAWLWRRRRRR